MKKNKILILICLTLVFSVLCGCKNISSIWRGDGDRPHTSITRPIDNDEVFNTINFNVVSAGKLSEVESQKEQASYDEYVNLKSVIQRVKESVVEVYATTSSGERFASGVVIGVSSNEPKETENSSKSQENSMSVSASTDSEVFSYIVTCHNVIDKATNVLVKLGDGSALDAYFIGSDPDSDISVIGVKKSLTPVEFYTDTDTLEIGESVVAIGNPLQIAGGTATTGILSSAPTVLDIDGKGQKVLLTDASINKGNSGGGLFTSTGFFIGMINASFGDSFADISGLDFAVCGNELLAITKELVETSSNLTPGYVKGKYLLGYEVTDEYGNRWGTQINVTISSLDQSGTFSASNLKVGDIIKTVTYNNDTFIATNSNALNEYFSSKTFEIGDVLSFSISRNETSITVPVTIKQYIYEL